MKKTLLFTLTLISLTAISGCTKHEKSATTPTVATEATSTTDKTETSQETDTTTAATRHERQHNENVTGASKDEDTLTGASPMTVGKVEAIKIIKESTLSGYDIGQMIQLVKTARTTEAMLENFNQVNDSFSAVDDSNSIAKMKDLIEQLNN
ncbi:hypothetical protein G7081_01505 [Vagococcus coleopterorum]|uniref:Lipoprotein n=1 Tax=Vagococcus coleopterorum TaxID=2714946 RepID=A0A6G8ALC3_9ENTE|nr:hypothetical protein [Vagococcus coleopterorum]QIL45858.1 hypothetical protein G7081_01505 [Vagococcus coleopterorum]